LHDAFWLDELDLPLRKRNRTRRAPLRPEASKGQDGSHKRPGRPRPEGETFRCRHCKRMVGPTLCGGRHRNHCPVCLYSRHVDDKRPGDRASDCRSLMAPVGLFARRSGEQVIVHRCLGCGVERSNRVAADDNPLAVMRLSLVEPASPAAEDAADSA
jgi:RNHCP domain